MINFYKIARQRIVLVLFILILAFFGLFFRLFFLSIIQHDFLKEKALNQQKRVITLSAKRGNIYDNKEELLATSIKAKSLYAVPKNIKDKRAFANKIAKIINLSPNQIYQRVNNQRSFVWLKRKLDNTEFLALEKIKDDSIDFLEEEKRVYLYDSLASHVIGFTDIDNKGMSGIELSYNEHLKGENGKLIIQGDLFGREVFMHKREVQKAIDGNNVYLSISSFLQYITERELRKAIINSGAKAGSAIILEPYSGEILAMASYPDYDLNQYFRYNRDSFINRAIETVYEPGSTFKVITVASAMNEKLIDPYTRFECPDSMTIDDKTIRDSHPHPTEIKTTTEILAESLNIGMAKISFVLGKNNFYNYIKKFGFGKKNMLDLPGEANGIVKNFKSWTKIDQAVMSYGQGIAVTPIQLVMAMGAIANGGTLYEPKIVRRIQSIDGSFIKKTDINKHKNIINTATSEQLKKMMVKVTTEGTGAFAKIYGYNVAGKTGTAQKVNPQGGYLDKSFVSSFIGFFPAEKPKAVILVVIDSPQYGKHAGSTTAAPAFKKIAEETLKYLSIPPR